VDEVVQPELQYSGMFDLSHAVGWEENEEQYTQDIK